MNYCDSVLSIMKDFNLSLCQDLECISLVECLPTRIHEAMALSSILKKKNLKYLIIKLNLYYPFDLLQWVLKRKAVTLSLQRKPIITKTVIITPGEPAAFPCSPTEDSSLTLVAP